MKLYSFIKTQKFYIIFLMLLMAVVISRTTIYLMDDGYQYEAFAEKLIDEGRVDFSIPGFHGSSLFASVVYLITRSHVSIVYFEILAALLAIPIIFFACRELYGSPKAGVFAASIYSLMPFVSFNSFRGWTGASFTLFFFLTIYLLWKRPGWSFLPWGVSMLIKPFSVALLPLFIYKKRYKEIFFSFLIPFIYVAAEFMQVRGVTIGVHKDLTAGSLFDFSRLPLNLAFAFQSFFSVHNYTPYNPVYLTDMIHFSPLLTFFALMGVVYFKKYFPEKKLFFALLFSALIALLLPASFYYYDRYYFLTFEWMLVLISLAVIPYFSRLIPVIALNFGFQFFYFYLAHKSYFWPNGTKIFFILPVFVFLMSVIFFWRKKLDGAINSYEQ